MEERPGVCPWLARIPSARAVRVGAPTGPPRARPHTPQAMATARPELCSRIQPQHLPLVLRGGRAQA